jgi:SAM-dependent methyltransferase
MMMIEAVPVDPSNTDQLAAWDGDEGAYWAAHADQFERALVAYDDVFFAAAAIESGDRVLDIGCGTGSTTRHAARTAERGSVLGVDLSSAMLTVARTRAAIDGLANVSFERFDAQIHPFQPGAFDVVIGRTSVTFFGERVAGLVNIGRALRPGGRLALLTWQPAAHNEWIRDFTAAFTAGRDLPTPSAEAPGPFTLSEPDVIHSVLDAAGYHDVTVNAVQAPMWFGVDADHAYRLVLGLMGWMLDGLDDNARGRATADLRATIVAHATPGGVLYDSAAWIIGARRP